MKSVSKIFILVLIGSTLWSCQDNSRPNYQFFPNMYEPVGYEAYGEYEVFPNSQEALLPVEGTIARGYSLYDYDNTNEGYEAALKSLKSPLEVSEIDPKRGKEL